MKEKLRQAKNFVAQVRWELAQHQEVKADGHAFEAEKIIDQLIADSRGHILASKEQIVEAWMRMQIQPETLSAEMLSRFLKALPEAQ